MKIPEWLEAYLVNGKRFFVLLWKNWRIGFAHPQAVLTNSFLPILCAALLLTQRLAHEVRVFNELSFQPFSTNLSQVQQLIRNAIDKEGRTEDTMPIWEVAFSPHHQFLETLMKRTCKNLGEVNGSQVIPVNYSIHKDEKALEKYLITNPRVFVGVAFKEFLPPGKGKIYNFTYELRFPYNMRTVALPNTAKYKLTWRTSEKFQDVNANVPRQNMSEIGGNDAASYVAEGFTLMVNELSLNFVEMKANLTTPIRRPLFQRLPHGKFVLDAFIESGDFYISFWIVISGFWAFSDNILCICTEKENQIKEVLKIAGLSNLTQWSAWFLISLTKALITRAFILLMFATRLGNFPAILTYCNPLIYFLLQVVYSTNLLTLAFFISVIFKDPHAAVFFGRTIYFLLALPYFVAREWYDFVPSQILMIMCLFGHSGYGLGVHVIYMNEKKGEGSKLSNLFKSPDEHTFSLGNALGMMFLGAVIHIIALLYIEQVRPGKYGIPKKWYFLFQKSFWCKVKEREQYQLDTFHFEQQGSRTSLFQPMSRIESRKAVAIYCEYLSKRFSNGTVGISNLSLKLHEGELVVLLGFNDSGKTVALSMLAGIMKPTSGTIFINGYDMLKFPKIARKTISYVPQENILFQNLTVRQNMQFYCLLRGSSKYQTELQITKYMTMLEFDGYEDLLASKLQEFQQRKLSIAAALCGNTKIILIDSPVVGADPRQRKKVWQMLFSEKAGRTILVTTQYMDEGEKLADKIGILSKGKLQAFGDPLFIKKKFGKGHLLVCVKKEKAEDRVDDITRLINKYLPVEDPKENDTEFSYELRDEYISLIPKMLEEMEMAYSILNIRNMYIKAKSTQDSYIESENKRLSHTPLQGSFLDFVPDYRIRILRSQWKAMLYKKLLLYKYNIRYIICQFIIILFSAFLLYLTSNSQIQDCEPLFLIINQTLYDNVVVTVDIKDNVTMNREFKHYVTAYFPHIILEEVPPTTTTNDYMLSKYRYGTPYNYYTGHMAGISYIDDVTTIWFNNYYYHSIAVSQNLVLDVIAKTYLGDNYLINVYNHPLPKPDSAKLQKIEMESKIFNAYLITWFSLVIGLFIISPIKERCLGFVQQQYCHGVKPWVYWLSHFLLDYSIFLTIVCLYVGTACGLEVYGFGTTYLAVRVMLVLLMFGLASLSFLYLISKMVDSATSGMGIVYLIYLTFGFMISIFVYELRKLTQKDAKTIFHILHYIFSVIPSYGLYNALEKIHTLNTLSNQCREYCYKAKDLDQILCDDIMFGHNQICKIEKHSKNCCYDSSYGFEGGIMIELLYFFGFSIFCLLSVILVDSKVFTKKIDPIELSYQEPDEDVLREKIRAVSINRKQLFQTAIVMKDVTKVYDNEIAVKNLTMRIEEGESFGFIGLAGSGKSTVLNILSGETIPNRGGAYYRGRSLITKRKQCQKEIGYCPDASYYDDFTINEYIKVFLMIHGYNRKDVKRMPLEFASAFMFSHHIKKKLKDCSKYTKKKINLSVALIGCPKLVMIDEPTIGLDPFKSEVIWKIINGMRRSGKTVIISTFSVKEASELCDRIGILCNGELINVGTKSEILSRFGEGWILQIRVNERAMKEAGQSRSLKFFENIDEFVTLSFFGAILREKIGLSIQYFVPITPEIGVRWSRTFRMMEANKERLGIEDYSVSVVNVKEVYLIRTENQAELKPNK